VNDSDELLYSGRMYSDTIGDYINYNVYRYDDIDPRFICKVAFEGIDEVYVGINYQFMPKDNADFLEAMDNMSCFTFNEMYDYNSQSYIDFDVGKFCELLNAQPYQPVSDSISNDAYIIAIMDFSFKGIYNIFDHEIIGYINFWNNGEIEFYLNDYPEICSLFLKIGEENTNIISQIVSK
jgi:hypothetical protein